MKEVCIKILIYSILCVLFCVMSSCRQKATGVVTVQNSTNNVEEQTDPYIIGNQKIISLEQEEIDLVIKRHHWNMVTSGTGLCYEIIEQGSGPHFVEGDSVSMKYTMSLLSGKELYNSDTEGIKTFRVLKTEEIPALHEIAQLVSPGAKVRMVVPSHLAYGAGGDGQKIKGREALIMYIEILNH